MAGGKKYPKYSVLMTVYAKEKPEYLKEAIDSMLNQTIKPSEFVLVEDGPLTEGLYDVIKEFEKHSMFKVVILKDNQGSGLAAATGVKACSNEWIARLDSDDYSSPERIQRQFDCIANRAVDIIGTDVVEFDGDIKNIVSRVELPSDHDSLVKFAKKRCPLRNSAALFKKTSVIDAGNYRNMRYAEDYDLYIRMIMNGQKMLNVQEPLVYVRVNGDFYKRRGGISYAKLIYRFKKSQYKRGFYSLKDYMVTCYPHVIVALIPNWARALIYKKLLRRAG